jgi:hypothetical protein
MACERFHNYLIIITIDVIANGIRMRVNIQDLVFINHQQQQAKAEAGEKWESV